MAASMSFSVGVDAECDKCGGSLDVTAADIDLSLIHI